MKKTSKSSTDTGAKPGRATGGSARTGTDWSRAFRNPYAAYLAERRWHVRLDPDLVDLPSGSGDPGAHLLGLARRRGKPKERLVISIPMTEREFAAVRPLLERIGATVELVPPHPGTLAPTPRRRKAG